MDLVGADLIRDSADRPVIEALHRVASIAEKLRSYKSDQAFTLSQAICAS